MKLNCGLEHTQYAVEAPTEASQRNCKPFSLDGHEAICLSLRRYPDAPHPYESLFSTLNTLLYGTRRLLNARNVRNLQTAHVQYLTACFKKGYLSVNLRASILNRTARGKENIGPFHIAIVFEI